MSSDQRAEEIDKESFDGRVYLYIFDVGHIAIYAYFLSMGPSLGFISFALKVFVISSTLFLR
jgi:hypothetical protein